MKARWETSNLEREMGQPPSTSLGRLLAILPFFTLRECGPVRGLSFRSSLVAGLQGFAVRSPRWNHKDYLLVAFRLLGVSYGIRGQITSKNTLAAARSAISAKQRYVIVMSDQCGEGTSRQRSQALLRTSFCSHLLHN